MPDILRFEESVGSPGKFEQEARYVPYYWEMGMDGGADDEKWEGDTPIWIFNVTPEDKAMFPELKNRKKVGILEDDQGFVREW